MNAENIVRELKRHSNPKNVAGMARFGINPANTLGISIHVLRGMAKELGVNHDLDHQLWASGIHEARILAAMIDDPSKVTARQMESWVKDFYSWDVCDQVCSNLFDKTNLAYSKALAWSGRREEFVKRAGFALMAALAFHDKKAPDSAFREFLSAIKRESNDDRNFVKKAVNWALRQVGKRNLGLNREAVGTAREIRKVRSKSARWIANDALRELTNPTLQARLRNRP